MALSIITSDKISVTGDADNCLDNDIQLHDSIKLLVYCYSFVAY